MWPTPGCFYIPTSPKLSLGNRLQAWRCRGLLGPIPQQPSQPQEEGWVTNFFKWNLTIFRPPACSLWDTIIPWNPGFKSCKNYWSSISWACNWLFMWDILKFDEGSWHSCYPTIRARDVNKSSLGQPGRRKTIQPNIGWASERHRKHRKVSDGALNYEGIWRPARARASERHRKESEKKIMSFAIGKINLMFVFVLMVCFVHARNTNITWHPYDPIAQFGFCAAQLSLGFGFGSMVTLAAL